MSLFCLVHGSAQGPTGWKLLVAELRARGHDCICVDLPTGQPEASATQYAKVIGAAIAGADRPIVVAHSASGLFLPLVPDHAEVGRLVHDCSPDMIPWALSTLRMMYAKQAIIEECPLDKWPLVPSSYISCSEDRTINPHWWEAAARERLHTDPIPIKGGHAPYVSRPEALAEILVDRALC